MVRVFVCFLLEVMEEERVTWEEVQALSYQQMTEDETQIMGSQS